MPEGSEQFAPGEHAGNDTGLGEVCIRAKGVGKITAWAVVHEDHHGFTGLASRGLDHAVFECFKKVGVPGDDLKRRAGGAGHSGPLWMRQSFSVILR